jgi:hypothetical protein
VPSAWICKPKWYATGDGCDCNCGAYDPDCAVSQGVCASDGPLGTDAGEPTLAGPTMSCSLFAKGSRPSVLFLVLASMFGIAARCRRLGRKSAPSRG